MLAALALLAVVLLAESSARLTGERGARPRPSASTSPGLASPPATATPPPNIPPAERSYAVGDIEVTYSEPGKQLLPPHSPDGDVPAVRQVRAEILYPALSPTATGGALSSTAPASASGTASGPAASPTPVTDATPAGDGPFPLVVFGPGFDQPTAEYLPVLSYWASHGFVVAAITFPLTNPDAPGGPYRPDILNQPGDMAVVAQDVLAASSGTGVLHGLVNPAEIALAGQSDGGDTALALAYSTCCRALLPHVAATVILSGAELHSYGGFPGTFFPTGVTLPPLLGFQGTDDPVYNPPAYTNQYFAAARAPKYLVCLRGADHLEAYTTYDAYEAVVARASTDYLDYYLWHLPEGLTAMTQAVSASPLAYFATSCPLI